MNVFDYFFSCFKFIINILDHDFFGFGFSYLDFFLASSLAIIILKFLLQGFNEQDRFNFLSLSGAARDFEHEYQMDHKKREIQITNAYYKNKTSGKSYLINTERTKYPDGHISIYSYRTDISSGKTKFVDDD